MSFAAIIVGIAVVAILGGVIGFNRSSGGAIDGPDRASRVVKRFLDIAVALLYVIVVAWPVAAVGIGLFGDAELRTVDVYLGFDIAPPTTTAEAEPIGGRATLNLAAGSQSAWFLTAAISEFFAVLLLLGLVQLRAIFNALSSGSLFAMENARRLLRVGIIVIAWYVVTPVMQYLGGQIVLEEFESGVEGLLLYPAAELSVVGLLIGVALIAASGVLREASRMHDEQALTI